MLLSAILMLLSGWHVSHSVDPMTDAAEATAVLVGDGGDLIVFCAQGGSPYLSFRSSTFLGGGIGRYELRDFYFRFDDAKMERQSWKYVRDEAFPYSDERAAEFVTKMIPAKQLRVRAVRYDRSYVDASFDLEGTAPALNEVFVSCGIG
jgi:hypothetical protein